MVTSTHQHVSVGENDVDGDELGGKVKVIVGARDDVGDVEGDNVNEEPHDDAQKGPWWDSCGVS